VLLVAKIPYRPEPKAHTDYNVVLKRDNQLQNKTEESALFKNAIRLADERNQSRTTNATVRGGEKEVNERTSQLKEGRGSACEIASSNKTSTARAEVRSLAQHKADTKAALDAENDIASNQPSTLEQGLNEVEQKSKKRNKAESDVHQLLDAQAVVANAANAEQATPLPGTFMSEPPRRASQDMGQFESIQAAVKFLDSVNTDTTTNAWRFSLPGEEFVTGVHMERDKSGGWSITVASDEEHTDSLNEHLDALVAALEESGLRVSNVGLS